MKLARHIIIIAAGLFLILGVPFILNAEKIGRLIKEKTDAVSSATMVVPEKPSGEYYVLINKELHKDTLGKWLDFFEGEAADGLFEDIVCTALDSDEEGLKTADHYMSRLPENQMSIRPENAMLAMSKLQWGKCDIFIISAEAAGMYHLETVDESVMAMLSL